MFRPAFLVPGLVRTCMAQAAATKITFATSSGCESISEWLAPAATVVWAPIRDGAMD